MRELAVEASNDTNTTSDRKQIQLEMNQLVRQVDQIKDTTQFNTEKILNGNFNYTGVSGTATVVNPSDTILNAQVLNGDMINKTTSLTVNTLETDASNSSNAVQVYYDGSLLGYKGSTIVEPGAANISSTITGSSSVIKNGTLNIQAVTHSGNAVVNSGAVNISSTITNANSVITNGTLSVQMATKSGNAVVNSGAVNISSTITNANSVVTNGTLNVQMLTQSGSAVIDPGAVNLSSTVTGSSSVITSGTLNVQMLTQSGSANLSSGVNVSSTVTGSSSVITSGTLTVQMTTGSTSTNDKYYVALNGTDINSDVSVVNLSGTTALKITDPSISGTSLYVGLKNLGTNVTYASFGASSSSIPSPNISGYFTLMPPQDDYHVTLNGTNINSEVSVVSASGTTGTASLKIDDPTISGSQSIYVGLKNLGTNVTYASFSASSPSISSPSISGDFTLTPPQDEYHVTLNGTNINSEVSVVSASGTTGTASLKITDPPLYIGLENLGTNVTYASFGASSSSISSPNISGSATLTPPQGKYYVTLDGTGINSEVSVVSASGTTGTASLKITDPAISRSEPIYMGLKDLGANVVYTSFGANSTSISSPKISGSATLTQPTGTYYATLDGVRINSSYLSVVNANDSTETASLEINDPNISVTSPIFVGLEDLGNAVEYASFSASTTAISSPKISGSATLTQPTGTYRVTLDGTQINSDVSIVDPNNLSKTAALEITDPDISVSNLYVWMENLGPNVTYTSFSSSNSALNSPTIFADVKLVDNKNYVSVNGDTLTVNLSSGSTLGGTTFNVDLSDGVHSNPALYTESSTEPYKVVDSSSVRLDAAQRENRDLAFQLGANQSQMVSLGINDMGARALGLEYASGSGTGTFGTGFDSRASVNTDLGNGYYSTVDVTTDSGAEAAISIIDNANQVVSAEAAKLGALQDRLTDTINNLQTSLTNLTAAEGVIKDADMAKEFMIYSKQQVLLQSSMAVLSQANTTPQQILKLFTNNG